MAEAFGNSVRPESKPATNENETRRDQERGLELLIAILLAMGYGGMASLSFLPPSERNRVLDAVVRDASARLIAVTKLLMNRQITTRSWLIQMRDILTSALAAGSMVLVGREELTDEESKSLVKETNLQYGYLVKWHEQFRDGRQQINEAMVARADLYARAIWSVAWRVWAASQLASETSRQLKPWCLRVLGPSEHCKTTDGIPGCIELANKGWVPLEDMTPIGATPCGPRCRCGLLVEWRPR